MSSAAEGIDRRGERVRNGPLGGHVAADRDRRERSSDDDRIGRSVAVDVERRPRRPRPRRAPRRPRGRSRRPPRSPARPCPASSPGGGASESLYSSSGQYSTAKLSASVSDTNAGRPPRRRPSPRSRGDRGRATARPRARSRPAATSPTFSIRTTRGSGSPCLCAILRVAREVRGVVLAVALGELGDPLAELLDGIAGGVERDPQRHALGVDEMVGAGRADGRHALGRRVSRRTRAPAGDTSVTSTFERSLDTAPRSAGSTA